MKSNNLQKYTSVLLLIAPVLFFVYYVWNYTINVPFLDDSLYYTKCLVDVQKSKSLTETFWIFMRQHTITEHKTPVSRLAAWLIYKTTGKLDYVILAHIGNLALLGMLVLFWTFFRKINAGKLKLFFFLPIPFLLFQMQTYENQFWTICNWTYYPIGYLQMVVLYFLSYQKPRHFIYAVFIAILVTFIFSNGMFVFLPVAFILIFQKRYKELAIMILLGVLCVGIYFSNYRPSPIAQHQQLSLKSVLEGFLLLLGSYIDVKSYHFLAQITCTAVGIMVIGFLIHGMLRLSKMYFSTENLSTIEVSKTSAYLFLSSSIMCLCMSAGAVAYSRYSGQNGFEEMFTSRYQFISVTLLCLVYLFSITFNNQVYRRRILIGALPITIFLYGYSYYFLHENNVNFRERLVAATFNFKYHNSWVLYPFDNDWTAQVDTVNEEAIKQGIYQLPAFPFTPWQEAINKDSVQKISNLAFSLEQKKDRFILKNETINVENPLEIEQNIVLKSKNNTYLLPLNRQKNKSRKDLLFRGNLFWKGFQTDILKNTFIPDEYSIGLLKIQDGKYDIQYSNLKIKL
jgi:hypothetical protein